MSKTQPTFISRKNPNILDEWNGYPIIFRLTRPALETEFL